MTPEEAESIEDAMLKAITQVNAHADQITNRTMLVGPEFLLSYARHGKLMPDKTDDEILAAFADCWDEEMGCYVLKGEP